MLCFALLSSHWFLNSDVKKQEPCLSLKIVDEVSFYHLIFKEEIQKFVFYYNFKFLVHLIQLLDVTLASCMNISASTCGRTFNINGSNTKSEFHFPSVSLLLFSLACMHLSVGAFISAWKDSRLERHILGYVCMCLERHICEWNRLCLRTHICGCVYMCHMCLGTRGLKVLQGFIIVSFLIHMMHIYEFNTHDAHLWI